MGQHKLTFSQICAKAEKDNSEKLMSKARLASLVHKMPALLDIRKDIIITDFVVVELKNTNVGLHFPIVRL